MIFEIEYLRRVPSTGVFCEYSGNFWLIETQVERLTSLLLIKHLAKEDPEGALGGLESALPGHARHAVRLEVGGGRPPGRL